MKYLIAILLISLIGCADRIYPSPLADRGNEIRYKYAYNALKCGYCKKYTSIYKIVNMKKILCNKCFRKIRHKYI